MKEGDRKQVCEIILDVIYYVKKSKSICVHQAFNFASKVYERVLTSLRGKGKGSCLLAGFEVLTNSEEDLSPKLGNLEPD